MNVAYDREAIAAIEDLLRAGRWEGWLHARLAERGIGLHCATGMVLEHDKDFGLGEFLSQRWHYSRSYAGMRNAVARAAAASCTPSVHRCSRPCSTGAWRGTSSRAAGGRREFVVATPLIFLYTLVWAAGEAVGYAFGGGRSLLKVR